MKGKIVFSRTQTKGITMLLGTRMKAQCGTYMMIAVVKCEEAPGWLVQAGATFTSTHNNSLIRAARVARI
jgi:hypothetical protein